MPKAATSHAPHAFNKHSTLNTRGCGGGKDERWHYDRDIRYKVEQSPGPGSYEFNKTFTKLPDKMNGLGRVKRFHDRSIDYSVEKDFISKETPGPGNYEYSEGFANRNFRSGKMNPIPRVAKFKGGEAQVGKCDEQRIKTKPKAPNATFGSAK